MQRLHLSRKAAKEGRRGDRLKGGLQQGRENVVRGRVWMRGMWNNARVGMVCGLFVGVPRSRGLMWPEGMFRAGQSSWLRKVLAGTTTGFECSKQSMASNGRSNTT